MAKVQVDRKDQDGNVTGREIHRGFKNFDEAYGFSRGVRSEAERRGEQVTTVTSTHDD